MINIIFCFITVLFILTYFSAASGASDPQMDVKCTVYQQSDVENGDNVDVRIFVMGLKPSSYYTAKVIPDHNPPTSTTSKTDYEGIFWVLDKVPNGEKSLFYKVNFYEGNGTSGKLVATGDDDAPCDGIPPFKN